MSAGIRLDLMSLVLIGIELTGAPMWFWLEEFLDN